MTLVSTSVAAMLCTHMTLVLEMEERPEVVIASQINTAAITALSAIGTSVGVILHVSEVHGTTTALT